MDEKRVNWDPVSAIDAVMEALANTTEDGPPDPGIKALGGFLRDVKVELAEAKKWMQHATLWKCRECDHFVIIPVAELPFVGAPFCTPCLDAGQHGEMDMLQVGRRIVLEHDLEHHQNEARLVEALDTIRVYAEGMTAGEVTPSGLATIIKDAVAGSAPRRDFHPAWGDEP